MKYGIIFGGQSYEHEVSIISAIAVKKALKGKNLTFIFCDQNRKFWLIDESLVLPSFFLRHFAGRTSSSNSDVGLSSEASYSKILKELTIGERGFYSSGMFSKNKLDVDVYINLIHGCDGEDGKMASLLEFFGIPAIGSRLEASVLSYNKILTKNLAKSAGVKTVGFQVIKRTSLSAFNYPIVIKPAHIGSSNSSSINIVNNDTELDRTLDRVFDFDNEAIVEPYIPNIKEYSIAGCKIDDKIIFSNIENTKNVQNSIDFSRENIISTETVGTSIALKIKDAFTKIYNSGFDGALIKCDFFEIDNEVYLNEINPNPGGLANYLFDDFPKVIDALASSLPLYKEIFAGYDLLVKINK